MKKVILSSPATTQSGYGTHSRQVAKWLLSREDVDVRFELTPWGNTPWILDATAHDGLIGKIMERSMPHAEKADVSIQLKLPNEWSTGMANVNVGITAAVETDRCLPAWITACNAMDTVIVPSNHAKANLTNTGAVTKPLMVVPESFTEACAFDGRDLPTLPQFSTPFNFLVFGQITGNNPYNDRKNTFFTLKWLCEAFKDDKDVGIVLKTNMGRNSKIDRMLTKNIVGSLLADVRKGPFPKVHLMHGDMTDREVARLYRHPQVKALVSLTRGEGFGLPTLEAAASGLPIIATNWSGHLDFLNCGKFISIYYQLQEVHKSRIDGKIFVPGSRWAEPSEEDFKKRVTKFRNSPSIPGEWAKDLASAIHQKFSFDAVCKAYDEAFKGIIT